MKGSRGSIARGYGQLVRACALVVLDRGTEEDMAQESFARLWVAWERIWG